MAKKSTQKKLPKGMYELRIKGIKDPIIVQLQAIPIGMAIEAINMHNRRDDSIPEHGLKKFFVCCSKLSIYTGIGADNRHHAANKATKLFGPNWSSLTQDSYLVRGYVFEPTTSFKELLNSLQN